MGCGCLLRWVVWGGGLLLRHSLRLLGIILIFFALFLATILGYVFLQDTCREIYICYWSVWGFGEKLGAFIVIGLFIFAYCSCILHFLACVVRGPGNVPKNWNPVSPEEFEYEIDDDFDEESEDDIDDIDPGVLADHEECMQDEMGDDLSGLVERQTLAEWRGRRHLEERNVDGMSVGDDDDDDDNQSHSDLEGGDARQLLIPRKRRVAINVKHVEAGEIETIYLKKFSRYCQHCATVKPPRSHHCHICNRCILRYDHHCPWIGGCVGHFNQKHFIGFIFFAVVSGLIVVCVSGLWLLNNTCRTHDIRYDDEDEKASYGQRNTYTIASLMFTSALVVCLIPFGGWHVYLLASGQSTLETVLQSGRTRALPGMMKIRGIYDRGWKENIGMAFGSFKVWTWFLPNFFKPVGDGMSFPSVFLDFIREHQQKF